MFHEFLSEDQKKKKGLCPKSFMRSWCKSTKITKIRAVNTNLGVSGLDLHSNSPKPVNFFGAQPSLGRAQVSFGGAQALSWGGHGPEMPPHGAGPETCRLRSQGQGLQNVFSRTPSVILSSVAERVKASFLRRPRSHDLGFNPHPGHVVASLDKALYDDYLCLVASSKQQIYVRRSETSTGKVGKR